MELAPKTRISGLDGLRAVAIVTVVASHVSLDHFGGGGYIGVELFFVLSGYLITSILLAEFRTRSRIDFRAFYARRALRLLPALLALLAVLGAVAVVRTADFGAEHPASALLASLFYVGNWYRIAAGGSGVLNHTWSLAIEEQFYLLWPPILFLALRRSKSIRTLAIGLAVAALGVFFLRIALSGHVRPDRIYAGSDTRCDGLLLGCLFAVLAIHRVEYAQRARRRIAFATVCAVIAYGVAVVRSGASPLTISHGVSVSPIVCTVIVVGVVTGAIRSLNALLDCGLLVWVGKRSYGIYLWHYPAIVLAGIWLGPNMGVRLVAVAIAVAIAAASYRYVESPFLRRKAKFGRSTSSAANV